MGKEKLLKLIDDLVDCHDGLVSGVEIVDDLVEEARQIIDQIKCELEDFEQEKTNNKNLRLTIVGRLICWSDEAASFKGYIDNGDQIINKIKCLLRDCIA